ncbi:hemerythrin domain-containing protein [Actinacidiphila glaucinigra]|uniref:hemerythrin domain-containing protein n=1 Tax=Actinacidiphila glaucinigra TaxID=235986 RepID=UPI00386C45E3
MSNAKTEREQADELPGGDVIRILLQQHAHIRDLFSNVKNTRGDDRRQWFDELRATLAVHETAEELILRPVAKRTAGEAEVEERNREEKAASAALAELEKMDVDSAEFATEFNYFEQAVLAHAEREERQEFPAVREGCDRDQLRTMGFHLQSILSLAPTHPHPKVAGSATAQWMTGPFTALLDRVKDAMRGGSMREELSRRRGFLRLP